MATVEESIYNLVLQANPDNPLDYVRNIVKPLAQYKLDELILNCKDCDICKDSVKTVTRGNPNAPIMVIGEAVSKEQQDAGENTYPLYGDGASENLNRVLEHLNVNEDKLFFINSVNCFPQRNGIKRASTVAERRNCKTFLDYAIRTVDPILIICLGAVAVNGINEEIGKQKITDIRGKFFTYRGINVLPTFHPGYFNEILDKVPEELVEEYYNQFYDDIALAITALNEQRPDLYIIKED